MTDGNLLAFGCAVSFLVLAGAYVFLRERYEEHSRRRERRRARLKKAA